MRGRILLPKIDRYGYPCVTLSIRQALTYVTVHRLVAIAFLGPVPAGLQVDHVNGIKTDNRPCNLRFLDPSAQITEAVKLGLIHAQRGEVRHNARLDENAVRTIRRLVSQGEAIIDAGRAVGIGHKHAWKIAHGYLWKHVT